MSTPSAQAVEQLKKTLSDMRFELHTKNDGVAPVIHAERIELPDEAQAVILAAVADLLEKTGKDIIGDNDPTEPGTTWGGYHTRNKLRGEQRARWQDFITELRGQTK